MKIFWQDERLPLKKEFFGKRTPSFLEIGFGKGHFLEYLLSFNESAVGIEVSKEMIELVSKRLSPYTERLFLFHGDARFIIKYVLPEMIFEKIFLLFPFPWPKERHKKRRIYEGDFPKVIWKALKEEGKFYVVTDEEEFLSELKERFLKDGLFSESEFEEDLKEKAYQTKYAKKWKEKGKKIFSLCLKKNQKEFFLEKRIKITGKPDHFLLKSTEFPEDYMRKEEDRVFTLKQVFSSESGMIFKFFSKEEDLSQTLFFLMEKKRNIILRPLFREKTVFTEWIMQNIEDFFRIK